MARMTVSRRQIGPEGYSEDTMLPAVEELMGMDVCDLAGERIGTVDDAYTDTEGSFVRYLAVKTGWFGTRRQMIPIDDVHLSTGPTRMRSSPCPTSATACMRGRRWSATRT